MAAAESTLVPYSNQEPYYLLSGYNALGKHTNAIITSSKVKIHWLQKNGKT